MQQVVHSFRTGEIEVVEVPRPSARSGQLVVANEHSVVSSGTERMLVSFGSAGLVGKLRREPGRVQQVANKVVTDGLVPTLEAVRSKLDEPTPLGYASAGVVIEVADGVTGFVVGDRVATNGPHAEVVSVSEEFAARIPVGVSSRDAAYTALAAVALQALQEAEVGVGDTVAILGLGVIGRLAARIAHASGATVLAFDPDPQRAKSEPGVRATSSPESFAAAVAHATAGAGVDAVIITADVGGKSRGLDPMGHAEAIAKFRGRLVLVGGGDPTLDRRQFYAKELRFSVSHSYGGRQNFETVLALLADGRLEVASLTAATFTVDRAPQVYAELRRNSVAGALAFRYDGHVDGGDLVRIGGRERRGAQRPCVAVIGAGNFARRVMLPALQHEDARLRIVASAGGLEATLAARKFGFSSSTTSIPRILDDPDIDTVFVLTRHDSHAELAMRALRAGKNVWVEKPIALRRAELDELEVAWRERPVGTIAMAGFNRRFAPVITELRARLGAGPKNLVYQVHAGVIPADHWLLDRTMGGGRFVGEAIHFVDLARHLVGHPVEAIDARLVDAQSGTLSMRFVDGSVATIQYVANRSSRLPKETIEVFDGGVVYRVENFRRLQVFGADFSVRAPLGWLRGATRRILARQDKGHAAALRAFLAAVREQGPSPIPFHESIEVTRALFDALGVE